MYTRFVSTLTVLACMFAVPWIFAAEPLPMGQAVSSVGKTVSPIGSGGHLLQVVVGLAVIVGFIFLLSWLVKRFTQGGFATHAQIKLLSTMPLGTRERLILVEVGGKQLLLGVTSAQINSLHVFDASSAISSTTGASAFTGVEGHAGLGGIAGTGSLSEINKSSSIKSGHTSDFTSDFSKKLLSLLQQKNLSTPNNAADLPRESEK